MQSYVPPISHDCESWFRPLGLTVPGHVIPREVTLGIIRALVEFAFWPQRQVLDRFAVRSVWQEGALILGRLSVCFLRKFV